jgi:hypothetical protein
MIAEEKIAIDLALVILIIVLIWARYCQDESRHLMGL